MTTDPKILPITALTGPLRFDPEALLSHFKRKELNRGEHWLEAGKTCRHLAFLESGLLRHTQQRDGELITRWATLAGQYTVGFPSFIKQQPSDQNITAAQDCVLHELSWETWKELRREHAQLQEYWVAILEYNACCYEDRVWSLISGKGEARYRYMIERYPEFLLHLPQHYVAEMLGVAPRHLSRIRNKMSEG
ncbi:Crp/Fnr family transcriptional regulator [Lewinella sp. 4G2]|uniref:Crp/Fnr family transcriptional regulator n=1 Tax=Lewinella sp. 4G2 TaxID=1803372 RepID=UPI0007B48FE8|nr:Crp/Fnr family transcriptional regulator [Lewinella sp. 4G2]OAV43345.1 hypothetical protein A3850_002025 [Lewinella sp. 4G2]